MSSEVWPRLSDQHREKFITEINFKITYIDHFWLVVNLSQNLFCEAASLEVSPFSVDDKDQKKKRRKKKGFYSLIK